MSLSEHEKLYTPSHWSKRFESLQLLDNFFRLSENVIRDTRRTINHKLDVPYGTSQRTKYDIYGTDLPDDAPIILFIHGGYWQEMTKDLFGHPVKRLVQQGIKVVVTGYDLCPNVALRDIISQIKTVAEAILKIARDSGSRSVWIAGHSAGAHLAVSLLNGSDWMSRIAQQGYDRLLKGLLLIGGIYELEPLLETSFNNALKLTKDEARALSFGIRDAKGRQSFGNIKVIVTVGECDSPLFIQESKKCAQNLLDVVDNVEFLLLRNSIDHFDIVENFADENFVLTKLIVQNMRFY